MFSNLGEYNFFDAVTIRDGKTRTIVTNFVVVRINTNRNFNVPKPFYRVLYRIRFFLIFSFFYCNNIILCGDYIIKPDRGTKDYIFTQMTVFNLFAPALMASRAHFSPARSRVRLSKHADEDTRKPRAQPKKTKYLEKKKLKKKKNGRAYFATVRSVSQYCRCQEVRI